MSVGDIGNKIGFNAMDNGYLKFDNVRIPRENLLMRYAKVKTTSVFIINIFTQYNVYLIFPSLEELDVVLLI